MRRDDGKLREANISMSDNVILTVLKCVHFQGKQLIFYHFLVCFPLKEILCYKIFILSSMHTTFWKSFDILGSKYKFIKLFLFATSQRLLCLPYQPTDTKQSVTRTSLPPPPPTATTQPFGKIIPMSHFY